MKEWSQQAHVEAFRRYFRSKSKTANAQTRNLPHVDAIVSLAPEIVKAMNIPHGFDSDDLEFRDFFDGPRLSNEHDVKVVDVKVVGYCPMMKGNPDSWYLSVSDALSRPRDDSLSCG